MEATRTEEIFTDDWKQLEKEMKARLTSQAVQLYLVAKAESSKSTSKILPRHTFNNIMKRLGSPPWMNRFKIVRAVNKYIADVKEVNETEPNAPPFPILECILQSTSDEPSDVTDTTKSKPRGKGGRPKNENLEEKEEQIVMKRKLDKATEIASEIYMEARKKRTNGRVSRDTLKKSIQSAVQEVDLPPECTNQINKHTVRARAVKGNPKGGNVESPMSEVEDTLVSLCIHLNRMNHSIGKVTFLKLANDAIHGKPIEKKVIEFKKKYCGTVNEDHANLGIRYFKNFMKSHGDKINQTKVCKKDLKRAEWATFFNIQKMYDLLYEEMVLSGVATKLETDVVTYDHEGQLLLFGDDDDKIYGLPSQYELKHPEYVLFVDEVGSNTDMRKDKQGSKKVIAEKGFKGTQEAITTDLHYTVMGFTAATGEPVLCVVIFQSENQ